MMRILARAMSRELSINEQALVSGGADEKSTTVSSPDGRNGDVDVDDGSTVTIDS